jgi:hypothetical protein
MSKIDYDGIYFVPGENEDELKLEFFKFEEKYTAPAIESTVVGDKFHIAFFGFDENGDLGLTDHFEAIFADPKVYLESLAGHDLYGCVLRKTEKSAKWWHDYLTNTKNLCKINKEMKNSSTQ